MNIKAYAQRRVDDYKKATTEPTSILYQGAIQYHQGVVDMADRIETLEAALRKIAGRKIDTLLESPVIARKALTSKPA